MKKRLTLMVLFFGLAVIAASTTVMLTKSAAADFKDPVISLELIEVPQYDGFWYYGANIEPTKGKADDRGAPLSLAVTFNITNPNSYPIFLDGYRFTIAFEEFDMVTVNGFDTQWIPAGKINQLRATTMVTVRSELLNLLVTGGFKLKAKGTDAWASLEKWWTTIPDMAFPITIHEGAFTFYADGVSKTLPFKGVYP